jgi:hypothetical protein
MWAYTNNTSIRRRKAVSKPARPTTNLQDGGCATVPTNKWRGVANFAGIWWALRGRCEPDGNDVNMNPGNGSVRNSVHPDQANSTAIYRLPPEHDLSQLKNKSERDHGHASHKYMRG